MSSSEDYILNVLSLGHLTGLDTLKFNVAQKEGGRIVLESFSSDKKLKIEKILEPTEKDYFYTFRLRITNLSSEKFYMERGPVVVAGTILSGLQKKRRYAVEEATAFPIDKTVEIYQKKKN